MPANIPFAGGRDFFAGIFGGAANFVGPLRLADEENGRGSGSKVDLSLNGQNGGCIAQTVT